MRIPALVTAAILMCLSAAVCCAAAVAQRPAQSVHAQIVDLNSADAALLDTLPGIGSVLAQRIIEGRPYRSIDDLSKVKGLTKSKITALKGKVRIGSVPASKMLASQPRTATGSPTVTANTNDLTGSDKAPVATGLSQRDAAKQNQPKPKTRKVVNINRATPQELEGLPGIGPAKARAIVDHRTRNGDFKTIEAIQEVKGIKEGSFARIKELITVAN